MVQQVKPTRSELLNLKKRIKLANTGYKLLKKKRDGLILEFFNIMKKAKDVRSELVAEYIKAVHKMKVTRINEGDLQVISIAHAIKNRPHADVTVSNIMGVPVPNVQGEFAESNFLERGYGIISSTAMIDETADNYEKVVEKVLRVAEIEVTMKKLLQEIEKTKRKVNALERVTIPNMEKQASYIRLRLEEMERENFTRLKIIKK